MVEIGAGGGSIAHVDTLGRIAVGPESAGADPGPVCYGKGGTRPAVTDANLALGRYDPARFAGGSIPLDAAAAHGALLADVGAPLGLTAEHAALGVLEIVDENMANAARVHAIESGKTYQGRTLIAFGGGGPVHACRVAEKIGISRVLVPSGAGVGSAIGFLRAPVGYEVVRSLYQRFSTLRRGCGERSAGRHAAGGGGGGRERQLRRANGGNADGVYALCRTGARNPGAAADCGAGTRRTSRRSAPDTIRNTHGSSTARCRDRMWRS